MRLSSHSFYDRIKVACTVKGGGGEVISNASFILSPSNFATPHDLIFGGNINVEATW
jgi:hypothetical protein